MECFAPISASMNLQMWYRLLESIVMRLGAFAMTSRSRLFLTFPVAMIVGLSVAWLVRTTAFAGDEDIQLLLPDMNVSSRPVAEFRAREATVSPISPGHAYVLLGRELDNGLRLYNTVAGFYPDDSKRFAAFMQLFSTKGMVTQKLDDAKSDIVFSVYITPSQEQKVAGIITKFDTSNYSLAAQNCVTMTKEIASAVGLKVPDGGADAIPEKFLRSLIEANKNLAPVPGPKPEDISVPAPPSPPSIDNNAIEAGKLTIDLTRPPAQVVLPPVQPVPLDPTVLPQPPPPPPPIIDIDIMQPPPPPPPPVQPLP